MGEDFPPLLDAGISLLLMNFNHSLSWYESSGAISVREILVPYGSVAYRFVKPNGNITGELNLGKVFSGPILSAVPFHHPSPRDFWCSRCKEESIKVFFPFQSNGIIL
jgi:hypothetical protein